MKHAFSAEIFLRESRAGYPINRARAMAELEHASQESEADFPAISTMLLAERKNLESLDYEPDLGEVLGLIWDAFVHRAGGEDE